LKAGIRSGLHLGDGFVLFLPSRAIHFILAFLVLCDPEISEGSREG
jgi:hypothetical protein